MGDYASVTNVVGRLPGRTISASTTPSTTTVGEWIDEAEAELNGSLASIGMSTPIANATGLKIVRAKVVSYVAGRTERSYRSLDDDSAGADLMEEFRNFIDLIHENPTKVEMMLTLSTGSSDGSGSDLRAYETDNSDGLSIADGDFDLVVTRGRDW